MRLPDEGNFLPRLGALLLTLGVLYFWGLGNHGLLEPDEGRYGEIPREMRETGNWTTPRLNYVKYFEKPALHYWLTAGAFQLLGETEFASRLVPALGSLGGAGLVALFGARLWGTRAGLAAGAVLGSSLLWFASAHINITDMTLTFFLTLSLMGFFLGMRGSRWWLALFYGGAALATLAKGLIGVVLPGAVIFWWIVLTRRWEYLRRGFSLAGILLFFALAAPWFLTVSRANPEFPWFFFVHEHFLRYTTMTHGRFEPWWFFLPVLAAGLLPWTGMALTALGKALEKGELQRSEREDVLFLLLWFGVILAFFSFSRSKLVPYILPVLPPLALLTGWWLEGPPAPGRRRGLLWGVGFSSLLMLPLALALGIYPFLQSEYDPSQLLALGLPWGVLLLGGVLALWWSLFRRPWALGTVLLVVALLQGAALKPLFGFYGEILSARKLAAVVAAHRQPGDVVANAGEYYHGLPFYLKQRVLLVDYYGELAFGASQDRATAWFLSSADFRPRWEGSEGVLLVAPRERYENFLQGGFSPGRLVGEDREQVVVRNR